MIIEELIKILEQYPPKTRVLLGSPRTYYEILGVGTTSVGPVINLDDETMPSPGDEDIEEIKLGHTG